MPSEKMRYKRVTSKSMSVDAANLKLQAVISTRAIDRDGDIIEPRGVRTQNYKQNPVVLWAHDKQGLPIAKATELLISDEMILAEVQFAPTKFGKEVFSLYEGGFMNAWSVGFTAEEKDIEPITDDEGNVTGMHFEGSELLEFSAVPVPANPQALVRAAKGWDMEKKKSLGMVFAELADADRDEEIDGFLKELEDELESSNEEEDESKKEKPSFLLLSYAGKCKIMELGEEEGWIKHIPREDLSLAPNAFKKSIEERGLAGKIPVVVSQADADKDPCLNLEFEIINQKENLITEAKIVKAHVALPSLAVTETSTQDESDRTEETNEDSKSCTPEDGVAREKELEATELDISDLSARVAALSL